MIKDGLSITSINDVNNDGIIYYGTPEQLTVSFNTSSTISPEIVWTTSDVSGNVMTISENGVVTTHQRGEDVTITATIKNTDISADITLTPYVKATGVVFGSPDVNYLIIDDHSNNDNQLLGAWAFNSGKSFNHELSVITPDNKTASSDVKVTISDSSIINIDNQGNITPIKAGTTTITASIDGYEDTITVNVYDLDVYIDDEGWKNITGKEFLARWNKGYNLKLETSNSNLDGLSFIWNKNAGDSGVGDATFDVSGNGLSGYIHRHGNSSELHVTVVIYHENIKIGLAGFYCTYSFWES